MKKIIVALIFQAFLITVHGQSLSQIKKELEATPDPLGYVKYKLKKKYKKKAEQIV